MPFSLQTGPEAITIGDADNKQVIRVEGTGTFMEGIAPSVIH